MKSAYTDKDASSFAQHMAFFIQYVLSWKLLLHKMKIQQKP